MAGKVDARLAELGVTLPETPMPAANYVPYVQSGNLVFISGQISRAGGEDYTGKVGQDISQEEGEKAARTCALALLAQLKSACGGDLDRVVRCVKLGGFVNCNPDFTAQPAVINGASNLMVDVLGDAGRHARFAVGAPALPMNVAVEIDGVFEIN
jgi:enamine deaminase RidA (YjgF/YER057c/UK114 family)